MTEGLASVGVATHPLHTASPASLPGLLAGLPAAAAAFATASGFTGAAQEVVLLPGPQGIAGAILGLGAEPPTPWSFGGLPQALPADSAWAFADPGEWAGAAVLGWALGAYRYTAIRPARRRPARLVPPPGTAAAAAAAAALCRARDLINAPANLLGPAELAATVQAVAAAAGARCRVVEGAALAEGFPALAAVGGGSPRAPRVAMLEWGPAGAPLVALCGKGVCFDTGGLDLKPSAAMLRMKKDMAGAAVVLAAAELIMAAALPVRLLVLVGAVENAVSGTAFRPLDALRTRAGMTVEVGNTDAEGRLVLCDLLTFAQEHHPALLLDCATLTGAARTALGPDLPALFTGDEALAADLLQAGAAAADPLWRLPLHDGYDPWLDSATCDLNTVATRPMAGAIVAALFLRRFVSPGTRWAHIDLYGWNDQTRPGRPEGGEAQTARAIAAAVARIFGGGGEGMR